MFCSFFPYPSQEYQRATLRPPLLPLSIMSATTFVTEAQFQADMERFNRQAEVLCQPGGEYVHITTTAQDVRKMEEAMMMEPGELNGQEFLYYCKGGKCGGCGRVPSFLDIVKSALRAHPAAFLADVFRGKYGKVVSRQLPTIHCIQCDNPIAGNSYATSYYACYRD